jgi:hypothetical protein
MSRSHRAALPPEERKAHRSQRRKRGVALLFDLNKIGAHLPRRIEHGVCQHCRKRWSGIDGRPGTRWPRWARCPSCSVPTRADPPPLDPAVTREMRETIQRAHRLCAGQTWAQVEECDYGKDGRPLAWREVKHGSETIAHLGWDAREAAELIALAPELSRLTMALLQILDRAAGALPANTNDPNKVNP